MSHKTTTIHCARAPWFHGPLFINSLLVAMAGLYDWSFLGFIGVSTAPLDFNRYGRPNATGMLLTGLIACATFKVYSFTANNSRAKRDFGRAGFLAVWAARFVRRVCGKGTRQDRVPLRRAAPNVIYTTNSKD